MRLLKVLIYGPGLEGIVQSDAIEYQGGIWLVPTWLDSPAAGVRMPLRIVRVDSILQPNDFQGAKMVSAPVPKAVLDGQQPKGGPFEVVESPPIRLPLGSTGIH